ncbi:hypothetical protein BCR42DRAFT_423426 [Absidia repens]|uniref:Uncharacterized protein n=1 Tax=Absidia repens TaxID=90262 RepID=A0A1X2I5R0_9FUNG|nr:hypothetical protein BCR42DRAFT_423426 [Absidia repens]
MEDNDDEYYSGNNNLAQYMNHTNRPSFDSFVSGNMQNIAQQSFHLHASNAKVLYNTWCHAVY